MSVDKVIREIETMSPAERRRVKAALEALDPAAEDPGDEAAYQRGLAAWQRLMNGFGEAGGKCLSEGIDEALYRGGR